MPTIIISLKDLESLVGKKLPKEKEKLDDTFSYVKGEVEELSGDELKLEIKANDRPDLWCVEGIARQLRGNLNLETGLKKYKIKKSNLKIICENVSARKFAACAIVKNIKITQEILKQLIQLQEKMNQTYGRNRRVVGTGIYDFDKIKPPIFYKNENPKEKFIPLDFDKELSLSEILIKHPKGVEFGHLIAKYPKYPVFIDAKNILSLPPIINSNYSGKVTEKTRNLFVEATGSSWKQILFALNITVAALADRGGEVYSVEMHYPTRSVVTPDFSATQMKLSPEEVNSRLGTDFSAKEISNLLEKCRYGITRADKISVEIPSYRTDIMHPVDLIEDVAIAYTYDKLGTLDLELPSVGGLSGQEKLSKKVRGLLIGAGMQEIMTFTLTNPENLFDKCNMRTEGANTIDIENPVSSSYTSLRNWLLPSVLEFLGKNTTAEYPQKVFEVGDTVVPANNETCSETIRKLCCAVSHDKVNFTEIKSIAEAILKNLGLKYSFQQFSHNSFIPNRCAKILINGIEEGFFGEVHPSVLLNWGIKMPVIAMEMSIS